MPRTKFEPNILRYPRHVTGANLHSLRENVAALLEYQTSVC